MISASEHDRRIPEVVVELIFVPPSSASFYPPSSASFYAPSSEVFAWCFMNAYLTGNVIRSPDRLSGCGPELSSRYIDINCPLSYLFFKPSKKLQSSLEDALHQSR